MTQKMIAKSDVSLNYPDASSDDKDPIINLINAYKYFLYAVQLAQYGKYLHALETFERVHSIELGGDGFSADQQTTNTNRARDCSDEQEDQ